MSLYLFFVNVGEPEKWKRKSLSRVWLFVTPWVYSPWNSPGQNTTVGSLSLLQEIFPTQGSIPGLLHCRQIPYLLSHHSPPILGEAQEYWSGLQLPSPWDHSDPGIEDSSLKSSELACGFFTTYHHLGSPSNKNSGRRTMIFPSFTVSEHYLKIKVDVLTDLLDM